MSGAWLVEGCTARRWLPVFPALTAMHSHFCISATLRRVLASTGCLSSCTTTGGSDSVHEPYCACEKGGDNSTCACVTWMTWLCQGRGGLQRLVLVQGGDRLLGAAVGRRRRLPRVHSAHGAAAAAAAAATGATQPRRVQQLCRRLLRRRGCVRQSASCKPYLRYLGLTVSTSCAAFGETTTWCFAL
jgi:hypothetical protein